MTDAVAPSSLPRPPGLMRWWGFGLVAGVIAVGTVVGPWWLGRKISTAIDQGLASQGWEFDPEHPVTVNLWSARIGGDNVRLRMIDSKQVLMSCARLEARMALLESLTTKDLIIAEVAAEGLTGTLRRGPDGRIPVVPEERPASGAPAIDWKRIDWKTNLTRLQEKLKERRERQAAEDAAAKAQGQPVRPQPEPDVDWPKAVKYQPALAHDGHVPRVMVRVLKVSGGKIDLPDQTPWDITAFQVEGTTIAERLIPGEAMDLTIHLTTEGAGTAELKLHRSADDQGTLALEAPNVPVAALAHPALAGDGLAAWGPTGNAAVTVQQAWQGWDLQGNVVAKVSELALHPTTQAPGNAQRIAQVVAALKGRTITWPVKLGGTLLAPTVVDSGWEQVLADNKDVLMDAAKEQAKDKALEKAQDLLDKQLKKNPEAEKAKGAAKDALKGLLGR